MAKLLLVAQADPNVCNTHGATPLTSAARVPHRPMYDTLIEHGAIVKESDYGRADEILRKEFINLLPDFFKSVKEGDEKKVVDFLEQGVPPNSVDKSSDVRCTALHYAADRHPHNCVQSSYVRIVEHLLKAKADPNVRDGVGSTAGHDVRSPILLEKMYEAGLHMGLPGVEKSRNNIGVGLDENLCLKNRDVLDWWDIMSSPKDTFSKFEEFMDKHSWWDINLINKLHRNKISSLYAAVEHRKFRIVNRLICSNANPNLGSSIMDCTPIHAAIINRDTDMVKLLHFRGGAEIPKYASNMAYITLMESLVSRNMPEMIQIILSIKPRPKEDTSLVLAIKLHRIECYHPLLSAEFGLYRIQDDLTPWDHRIYSVVPVTVKCPVFLKL